MRSPLLLLALAFAGGSRMVAAVEGQREVSDASVTVTYAVAPRFVDEGKSAGVVGTAHIAVTIGPSGNVAGAEVKNERPFELAEQARAAALLWRFNPLPGSTAVRKLTLDFVFEVPGAKGIGGASVSDFVAPSTMRVIAQAPSGCAGD